MLFGKISGHYDNSLFENLIRNVEWPNCDTFKIQIGNFSGGCFTDKRLPYSRDDLIYFDKEKNTLILIWGNIYSYDDDPSFSFSKSAPKKINDLFNNEGPSVFSKLNGDFSLVIFQARSKKLFLVRDHLGINPLAYYSDNKSFFFSTDIYSLCRVFSEKSNFNIEPLLSDLRFVDNLKTVNPLVKKVRPGHYIEYDFHSIKEIKYWFPEKIKQRREWTFEAAALKGKNLLKDAILIRSDSLYSASAHISGGLDSTLVGVLAKKNFPNQKKFFGFSWSPENYSNESSSFDERDLVKEVCEKNGIIPVFTPFNKNTLTSVFKESENLLPSIFEEHIINESNKKGINVIFSGWGGQEFLSTDNWGLTVDLFLNLKFSTFFKIYPLSSPKKLLKTIILQVLFPVLKIPNPFILKYFKKKTIYLKKPFNNFHKTTFQNLFIFNSRRQFHLGVLKSNILPQRTEIWAVNGFKNGIEYRYPLLDKRIIEFVLELPSEVFVNKDHSRFLFREIAKEIIPESIRLRELTIDPVIFSSFNEYIQELPKTIFDDLKEMKTNPYMQFVNYNLLEKDLLLYKKNKNIKTKKFLENTLFDLIIIHEFLKKYFRRKG